MKSWLIAIISIVGATENVRLAEILLPFPKILGLAGGALLSDNEALPKERDEPEAGVYMKFSAETMASVKEDMPKPTEQVHATTVEEKDPPTPPKVQHDSPAEEFARPATRSAAFLNRRPLYHGLDKLERPPRPMAARAAAVVASTEQGFDHKAWQVLPPLTLLGQSQVSIWALYGLALLGSSAGFGLFLHFISIGYAMGIALPVAYCLIQNKPQSTETWMQSLLVVSWGMRLAIFSLWREFINWPALHQQLVQVNELKAPPLLVKIVCWITYSFIYVCMATPCWLRLERERKHGPLQSRWSTNVTRLGLMLQVAGLLLETVADWQKSAFKASVSSSGESHRNQWCHRGVWKYSTHPNYAGEWLFWLGTYLGGCVASKDIVAHAFMLVGFSFVTVVLRGATNHLTAKQFEKYGANPAFLEFRRRYTVFGPWFWMLAKPQPDTDVSATTITDEALTINPQDAQEA